MAALCAKAGQASDEEESGEHNNYDVCIVEYYFVEIEEDTTCDATECVIGESGEDRPLWIQCECGGWFHLFCVGLHQIADDFQCDYCKILFPELAKAR